MDLLISCALAKDDPEGLQRLDICFGSWATEQAVSKNAHRCLKWLTMQGGTKLSDQCYALAIEHDNTVFLREHPTEFPDGSLRLAYLYDRMHFFVVLKEHASEVDIEDCLSYIRADSLRSKKQALYMALLGRTPDGPASKSKTGHARVRRWKAIGGYVFRARRVR